MWDEAVELKFTYLKKKDKSDTQISYHTPNVMDAGLIIRGNLEFDGYFHAYLYHDGFAFSTLLYEIKFNFKLEKGKEYIVYKKEGIDKLYANCPFTILYNREEEQEEEQEQSKNTTKFDTYTPEHMLRLIKLSNPQTIRDKIYTELPEKALDENSIAYLINNMPTVKYEKPNIDWSKEE